jgi:uncharacterized OB-fold protein
MAEANPAIEPASEAYWGALKEGQFRFQRCASCKTAWLPPRSECPSCWSPRWSWEPASGKGRLLSWVIFHTAFHEAFKTRLPYNVAVVELAEGPRLITNITNLAEHDGDVTDRAVSLVIEYDHDRHLPRFRID